MAPRDRDLHDLLEHRLHRRHRLDRRRRRRRAGSLFAGAALAVTAVALLAGFGAGTVVEGGSTISQQLVRNLYTGRERTFDRKVKEACLAIKLSSRWSKNKILAGYLNTVYYGNHAYGVEAAAQTYFSRHASELTLPQGALLAGLPQAPSIYDPFHNPRAATTRRTEVLKAMLADRTITLGQYRQVFRTP